MASRVPIHPIISVTVVLQSVGGGGWSASAPMMPGFALGGGEQDQEQRIAMALDEMIGGLFLCTASAMLIQDLAQSESGDRLLLYEVCLSATSPVSSSPVDARV